MRSKFKTVRDETKPSFRFPPVDWSVERLLIDAESVGNSSILTFSILPEKHTVAEQNASLKDIILGWKLSECVPCLGIVSMASSGQHEIHVEGETSKEVMGPGRGVHTQLISVTH